MKKFYKTTILIFLVLSLFGCKKDEKAEIEMVYINDKYPSFMVENIDVNNNEDITMFVELKGNPGFLTMALNIEYDQTVMTLMDIENGPDYEEYSFLGPKNKNSGCSASWYILDLPEKVVDGKLLKLHFKILDNVKSGEYPIKISRPNNGGIVDGNKEAIVINNAIGYVTIK